MRGLVAFVALSLPAPACSQAAPGFNLCVPPHRPACVFENSSKKDADACERDVKAYVGTVFRYRECLETESQRAVRESNDVLDHWRCAQFGERCRH